ncbi:DUF1682-domain-containing protein [Artomyces pyxidatus]|uniref:DUF1682-domain-containing protein n=1 Tax=Artomyces pyxidatus TaxID=48021 RepID=A0ACB8TK90_9AGAM|nr:DUF1682-domain-containing protein [Artomyces pyxidatus]
MSLQVLTTVTQFLSGLTPQPPVSSAEYDGVEYAWKWFIFRPAIFKNEIFLLGGVLFYLAFFWLGSQSNASKANSWFKAHLPLYEKQFTSPTQGELTKDGYTDFFNFSTGRRLVASLHTIFTLRPRHDLLQYIYQVGWTLIDLNYAPKDEILLDFTLHSSTAIPDFVWALVVKGELLSIKKDRWDLTFTRTNELPALPSYVMVMSEYADVTDGILKIAGPLIEALKDPKVQPYFRSLSITDQPRTRPDYLPVPREKHVLLSLAALPPAHADITVPLVTAVFSLIDALEKVNFRPETKTKLKRVREDFLKNLKDEAEKEKREELADARAAAKKKAEDERIAGLSAAEQQKILDRERKRSIRKTQGKMVKK